MSDGNRGIKKKTKNYSEVVTKRENISDKKVGRYPDKNILPLILTKSRKLTAECQGGYPIVELCEDITSWNFVRTSCCGTL